jgi:hypothetical protein
LVFRDGKSISRRSLMPRPRLHSNQKAGDTKLYREIQKQAKRKLIKELQEAIRQNDEFWARVNKVLRRNLEYDS